MTKNLAFFIGVVGLVAVVGVIFMAPKAIWSVGTDEAGTVTNAGDTGTADDADQPGDLILSSTNAVTVSASSVNTDVDQGYDVGDLAAPGDSSIGIGSNADYAYSVKNLSNGTDTIKVTVLGTGATVGGSAVAADWTISIYDDTGTTGVVDGTDAVQATGAGNTDVSFSFATISSNTTLNFIVRLAAAGAGTTFDGDTYTVTSRAESNNGTTDTWDASDADISANPFGGGFTTNGDQLNDATSSMVQGPVMFASASVDTANELPGNALTYTIQYDNDGLSAATNVAIINAIPTNTTYVQNSATGNSPHTGATDTPNINIGTLGTPDYQADGTAGTVMAVRWAFDIDVGAQDNSETTDGTSGVDGDVPDLDAGQIQYQVTIN